MSSYSRRLNKVSTPFKDVDSQDAVPSPKKEMYYLFRVDSNEWAGRGDLEELRRIAASQTAGAPKDLRVFSLLVNSALLHRPSTPGAFSRGGNGSKGGPCDSCKVKGKLSEPGLTIWFTSSMMRRCLPKEVVSFPMISCSMDPRRALQCFHSFCGGFWIFFERHGRSKGV